MSPLAGIQWSQGRGVELKANGPQLKRAGFACQEFNVRVTGSDLMASGRFARSVHAGLRLQPPAACAEHRYRKNNDAAETTRRWPEATMFYQLTEEETAMVRALAKLGTCEAAAAELDKPVEEVRGRLLALRDRLLAERAAA